MSPFFVYNIALRTIIRILWNDILIMTKIKKKLLVKFIGKYVSRNSPSLKHEHTHKYINGGVRGVMVSVWRNRHGDLSSKPGCDSLHFTSCKYSWEKYVFKNSWPSFTQTAFFKLVWQSIIANLLKCSGKLTFVSSCSRGGVSLFLYIYIHIYIYIYIYIYI